MPHWQICEQYSGDAATLYPNIEVLSGGIGTLTSDRSSNSSKIGTLNRDIGTFYFNAGIRFVRCAKKCCINALQSNGESRKRGSYSKKYLTRGS